MSRTNQEPEANVPAVAEPAAMMLFSDKAPSAAPAYLLQDTARGNESVSTEDMAMPRLKLMQPLSPEVNDDVKPGTFLNTVTGVAHPVLYAINLHFQKDFGIYKARALGGGWVMSKPTEIEAHDAIRSLPGTPGDYEVAESHRHVLCVLDEQGFPVETAAMFLASKSGLYTSRAWNTEIQTRGQGKVDRFASVWKLTTSKQTNSKGSWYNVEQEFAGWAPEELYRRARAAYDAIVATAPEIA